MENSIDANISSLPFFYAAGIAPSAEMMGAAAAAAAGLAVAQGPSGGYGGYGGDMGYGKSNSCIKNYHNVP